MNLQPIDGTASKQEEIDLLNKVAKLFGKGTYMTDFFSEKLLGWVEEQLKNDFPPELFEAIEHERKMHSDTLASSLKKDQYIRDLEAMIETKNKEFMQASEHFTSRLNDFNTARESYEETLAELRNARNDFYEEATLKTDELSARLMAAQTEVNRLKIEVYDLTHSK